MFGTPDIKFITGVCRSGKSKLLDAFKEYIEKNIPNNNIVHINFNLPEYEHLFEYRPLYKSKKYHINIIDRVGGGDSFGGGLIYAMLEKYSMQDTIDYAVAASCLKHSIQGDFNVVSVSEVLNLMKGDGSGRVQR